MRILAFETSAKAASAAVLEEDRLLGETYLNCGQTHSRTLMKIAEELLANCGLTPGDITAVACAAGPGSFTGGRIAMAQQAAEFDGIICCAMDARRQQVYNALFSCHGGVLTRLTEDRALSLEDLAAELKNLEKPKIMVGDGAQLCYNTLSEQVPGCRLAPEHQRMQRASGVALCARRLLLTGADFDGAVLEPNYLRLSQAERERNERLQRNEGEYRS